MVKFKSIEYFRVLPRWLFVKIIDEDGQYGWGESFLEGHTEAVEGTLNALDIEHIWQMAWRSGFYRSGPVFMSAISGIDIALWDLKGRQLGVPIHQLLSGKMRHKLFAARARIERRASQAIKTLGLDAALDFHDRLHKPMAKQLAKALEPHRPLFLEEPLLSEHPEGIKQLSGFDASVGAARYKSLRRCFGTASHCSLGPIALAACMQAGLTTPNFAIQEMSLGIHYNKETGEYDITSYVEDPGVFDVKDGYVDALTRPVLGIEVDEDVRSSVVSVDTALAA
ncbi:D-galactonate dehydratase [Aspergillus affinis]|uniref:D-galactonate dehydratase n=1 Tax=Aspergillus affinis TaxID=1070780 RepID=UPI0022FF4128|nr:D-galactonate dehydratase [Aspergillus affinis]KAI9045707.1 D-galactonate dehydratase [Aspergillus affinis]